MLTVVPQPENDAPATFDDFWLLYPRRVARKDARRAWERLTDAERVAALVGLVDWRRVWIARGDLSYVPYPATWLNGERWTDELPENAQFARPQAHTPFAQEAPVPRTLMPQRVKDALAKLRGR